MEQIEPIEIANTQPTQTIKFDYWTEELIQLMPLDINSLVFSGNLLFKSYLNYMGQTVDTNKNPDKLDYIDLYLLGSVETKLRKIENIVYLLETVFEQHINAGASDSLNNTLYIMIQGIPRIIRLINTNSTKPADIFYNFKFAHELMYWSEQGLYISPFAKLSIGLGQALANPSVRCRAHLHELNEVKTNGLSINSYIEEFPMVDTGDIKYGIRKRKFNDIANFYLQTKNLQYRDDVFRLISFLGLSQASLNNPNYLLYVNKFVQPNENFLQEQVYNIHWKKSSGGFTSGCFSMGDYDKIIMDVHIEECYKLDSSKYFYFLSVNNPVIGEKFKQMVSFCLGYLENDRTCILDSQALDPNEKIIFNVTKTKPDVSVSGISLDIDELANQCAQLNKLCFIAIHNKEIENNQDVTVVFSLYNLKRDSGITHVKKCYEKVFAEIFQILV